MWHRPCELDIKLYSVKTVCTEDVMLQCNIYLEFDGESITEINTETNTNKQFIQFHMNDAIRMNKNSAP